MASEAASKKLNTPLSRSHSESEETEEAEVNEDDEDEERRTKKEVRRKKNEERRIQALANYEVSCSSTPCCKPAISIKNFQSTFERYHFDR
jgi:hypothetical protein